MHPQKLLTISILMLVLTATASATIRLPQGALIGDDVLDEDYTIADLIGDDVYGGSCSDDQQSTEMTEAAESV